MLKLKSLALKNGKMKILSYEEFYNQPRLYKCSDIEIETDYKKIEIQQQYLSLRKRRWITFLYGAIFFVFYTFKIL